MSDIIDMIDGFPSTPLPLLRVPEEFLWQAAKEGDSVELLVEDFASQGMWAKGWIGEGPLEAEDGTKVPLYMVVIESNGMEIFATRENFRLFVKPGRDGVGMGTEEEQAATAVLASSSVDPDHWPCPRCRGMPTAEGHDPCIANLPGVRFACCGHGIGQSYVMFESGHVIRGLFDTEDGKVCKAP